MRQEISSLPISSSPHFTSNQNLQIGCKMEQFAPWSTPSGSLCGWFQMKPIQNQSAIYLSKTCCSLVGVKWMNTEFAKISTPTVIINWLWDAQWCDHCQSSPSSHSRAWLLAIYYKFSPPLGDSKYHASFPPLFNATAVCHHLWNALIATALLIKSRCAPQC